MNKSSYTFDPGADKLIREVVPPKSTYTSEEDLFDAVDIPPVRPNDRRMTDINRQQVADMLSASEAKVDARLANFDTSIKTGFAELRTEMAKQTGDLRREMAEMRGEMHKNTTDLIKWGIVTALALTSATVGILTFVVNNATPKSPAQPSAQPAPIVITVPAASPVQTPGVTPAPK